MTRSIPSPTIIVLVLVALSGCTTDAPTSEPGAPPPPPDTAWTESHSGNVTNAGAYACTPVGNPGTGNDWSVSGYNVRTLDYGVLHITLEWHSINPTMENLRVSIGDRDESLSAYDTIADGPSPLRITLRPDQLEQYPRAFSIAVLPTAKCLTDPGVGVHAASPEYGTQEQDFNITISWVPT